MMSGCSQESVWAVVDRCKKNKKNPECTPFCFCVFIDTTYTKFCKNLSVHNSSRQLVWTGCRFCLFSVYFCLKKSRLCNCEPVRLKYSSRCVITLIPAFCWLNSRCCCTSSNYFSQRDVLFMSISVPSFLLIVDCQTHRVLV